MGQTRKEDPTDKLLPDLCSLDLRTPTLGCEGVLVGRGGRTVRQGGLTGRSVHGERRRSVGDREWERQDPSGGRCVRKEWHRGAQTEEVRGRGGERDRER